MTTYRWTDHRHTSALSDAHNWSPGGGPPGAADIAVFGAIGGTLTGDATFGLLRFMRQSNFQITGTLTGAGLNGSPGVEIGGGAALTFEPGAGLSAPSGLDVGLSSGASEVLFNAASLTTGSATIGDTAQTSAVINLIETSWQDTNRIILGRAGVGTINIEQGAFLTTQGSSPNDGRIVLGVQQGAVGALNLDGGTVNASGNIELGGAPDQTTHGTGDISISNGGALSTRNSLGVAAGSSISLSRGSISANTIQLDPGATLGAYLGTVTAGSIINDGTISAGQNLDLLGSITGTGTLNIGYGAQLTAPDAITQSAISFAPTGTLSISAGSTINAAIENFGTGDTIAASLASSVAFNAATDLLTLYTGSTQSVLHLTGTYTGAIFHDSYMNNIGTITVEFGHTGR